MEELAVVVALGVGLVICATPLVSLFFALRARREIRELRTRHGELEARLAHAEWWVGELARRGAAGLAVAPPTLAAPFAAASDAATATAPNAATAPAATAPASDAATATAPAPNPPTAPAPVTEASSPLGPTPVSAAWVPQPQPVPVLVPLAASNQVGAPPTPAAEPTPPRFDFEKVVGVRLFAWLGGLGLFAGAAFFMQYSIEHDLVPPAVRVASGLLFGAAALLVGDVLRPRGDRAGQALSGAGVAILYASLYAAHALYHLVPSTAAFAGMALVTAVAGVIAARRRAFVLAVIGLVGGFLTPFLLATGNDATVALFAYVTMLDVGVLLVAARCGWGSLSALALLGSSLIYAAWASRYLDAHSPALALGMALVVALLFVMSGFLSARKDGAGWGLAAARQKPAPTAARYVAWTAAFAPMVATLFVTDALKAQIAPLFLAGYVAILLVGTGVMATVAQTPLLGELGAAASVVILAARLSPDVLGEQRVATLLAFCLPGAALCSAWWFLSRSVARAPLPALARSCAVALAGSWLILALAVRWEPDDAWSPSPFAVYALAHAFVMLGVGVALTSSRWLLGAQALALACLGTLALRYEEADLPAYAGFIVASLVVFFALPVITARARADLAGWIGAASAPVLHFALLYALAREAWPDAVLGAAALALAALSLLLLRFARAHVDARSTRDVTALLGALTLLFLSAAIPIALSREWITIAWALEALGLAWLHRRIVHRGLLVGSALLAGAAVVRLTVNTSLWEYHARSGTVLFNWYLYTFGLPALCLFAAAAMLRNDATAKQFHYPRALWFAGGLLAFVLLNVEIADAYSTGTTIGLHLGASVAEDMTYSLGWGVFALIVLVIGIRTSAAAARISALAVLLLAIAKVFLHDLWHLGALYRVGSMVGLAVALLAVSFLTQKYILRGERS